MNNIAKLRKIIEKSRFCIINTGSSILYIDPEEHSMSTMSLKFFEEFGNIKGNNVLSFKNIS